MTELLRLIMDLAKSLSPLQQVWQWEKGLYYINGRYQGVVGPGLKFVIPYICDVKTVSMVPEIETTPLQTITLRDGSSLTYSASLTVVVIDPYLAYNKVGHHRETIVELAARILSEGLADAKVERFDPVRGKRDKLLEEQRDEINKQAEQYGMKITAMGLNNFARGVRTVRLLLDRAVIASPGERVLGV